MISDDKIRLPFSQEQAEQANRDWGCNCGPASLAAVTGLQLGFIRPAVEAVGFQAKRYMSPSMMLHALAHLNIRWRALDINEGEEIIPELSFPEHGLCRIQWEGPWTAPGANPKWAYRHTHWIGCWRQRSNSVRGAVMAILNPVIFDINGGLMDLERWEEDIVPLITGSIPRADGEWHVTHSWEVETP